MFWGLTEEQISDLYRQYILPANEIKPAAISGPETWANRFNLFKGARTLRERVFARLVIAAYREASSPDVLRIKFSQLLDSGFPLDEPKTWTTRGVLAACRRSPATRKALSRVPFIAPPINSLADPELIPPLQDLADIIGWEATAAFKEPYYPGVVDVPALSRDEVLEVMTGMQREMDREASNRLKVKSDLLALTPERQRALAERRRSWFAKFGITPQGFPTRVFSLWDVSNELPPTGPTYDSNP